MANRTTRTPQKDGKFLAALATHGLVTRAAITAGYTRSRVYKWRDEDDTFRERWDDALSVHIEHLEAEVDRRAVQGVLKPVYYQGVKVEGGIPQYSDTLLMFRLKKLDPAYRDRIPAANPWAPKDTTRATDKAPSGGVMNEAALNRIFSDVYGLDLDDSDSDLSSEG